MKCPKCQSDNPDENKFCGKCGHKLIESKESPPNERYFDKKIEKIEKYLPKGLIKKILSQRGRIEGERKQVTVMFCDMEGFTRLVEKLGPEDAYLIMDEVYEILIQKVHEYDGTVNEMTGDGIMALFGAPITLEDSPQRAIRSALSIHRKITEFNNKQKGIKPIKIRIGVHTGPVVVGTLGNDLRVEFKAVGDTVNLASRMERLAEPGTTYVTEDTFKLTEKLFQFKSLGKIEVKGKEEAVITYKLISAKEDVYRPRLGPERMIYSGMVGRDQDLNKLELQVIKAVNGKGSVVNIIGEAGIGKSRLIAELKKLEVMKQLTLLEGRAISIGRNLCFHPIIDLLKHWAQITGDDSEATALSKLESAIKQVYPEEMHEVLPFIAILMGMRLSGRYAERIKGIEGEALEKLILKNILELLIKATEISPLVIVAEDIHWADTSSIELMESLFHLVKSHKILFMNVFRPGHKETGDRIVEVIREKLPDYYVEIILQPLDEKMSEALINTMLNTTWLHHAIRDQIVERADGNPFFLEEVVRSLIDEGAIVLKDGSYKVTEKIDRVIIPNTIHDVLMARIDILDEKTRELVKIASVIGRSFFRRILTDVVRTVEDIDSKLSYLKALQFILERKRMEEVEYLFKHALAHEAAYESILLHKRKNLHLKVARSIEKLFSDRLHEFYGMLAYHYGKSGDDDKTEKYLIKAGEGALRSSASSEALRYYQEGLKLYMKRSGDASDPEKLATFERNIALAFFNKGQSESALKHLDIVFDLWGIGPSKNMITTALKFICDLFIVIINLYLPLRKVRKTPEERDNEIFDLRYKKAISLVPLDPKKCFIEFISTLKRLTKFDISRIRNGIGIWMSASGLFSWSGISFRLSKRILEYNKNRINNSDVRQIFYYHLFELLYNSVTGNWFKIKEYNENLVSLNLRIGESWHVLTYLVSHGFIKIEQGAFRETEMIINKLSEIWEAYQNENALTYRCTLRRLLLMKCRKLHDALNEVDTEISLNNQAGRDITLGLGSKAVIQILLGEINGAKESLSRARDLVIKTSHMPPAYIHTYLMGQFLFDLHFLEQALFSKDKSLIIKYRKRAYRSGQRAIKNSKKYAFSRTEILRLIGIYFWLMGRKRKAIRYWNNSIEEAENLGARVELARTYMEIGKRFHENSDKFLQRDGIKKYEYLKKAREMFEEMDLQWDLDELNSIVA